MLTKRQEQAIKNLELALRRCARVGLQGGVFDTAFCVWSKSDDKKIDRAKGSFFYDIEEHGKILDGAEMLLDGGAGV